ncbi:hypothetical protein M3F63_07330 [Brachybacterium muris]|uniref:hypothetical protein n=1 Tax=Brachybacterium muris TaxID=219301 RepID=UPI00223A8F53|nr:hypothetical protein [Brachybacterium muris]MCT2177480.1 hypothetical protein [Brachybacterium muris]
MTPPRSAARLTAGAFSLLAAGALLAACGGGGDGAEPVAGGTKAPAATEQPATTDKGEDQTAAGDEDGEKKDQPADDAAEDTDSAGTDDAGEGDAAKDDAGSADGSGSGSGGDEAWPDSAAIDSALEQWAGTASVEPLASPDGLPFILTHELYDSSSGLTLDAAALENTEYIGSHGGKCTGSIEVGSSPALCTLAGVEGEEYAGKDLTATVHLVRSGAGNHALLMAVGEGETTELALPDGTQLLLGKVDHGNEVTGEMIGAGLVEAARQAAGPDGEVTDNAEVTCKIHGDESHAVCQLSALDEGTSGFWYATVQPGSDYEGYTYLYTQFIE